MHGYSRHNVINGSYHTNCVEKHVHKKLIEGKLYWTMLFQLRVDGTSG